MLWLAGGLFLFLRWVAKKLCSGKAGKWLWPLPFALLALALLAFFYAPIPFTSASVGQGAAFVVGWLLGLIGGIFGASGQVVAGVMLFCLLVAGLVDLIKDHKPDGWAKTLVWAAPVLALVAAGPIAAHVLQFTSMIGHIGPTVVNTLAS